MCWLRDLERRLALDVPDYPEIAERHAVDELGARPAGHPSNHPGFDVYDARDRKIEIKSKAPLLGENAPTHEQRSYVSVRERQKEADAYWFYLFGKTPAELRVFEMPTDKVFEFATARNGAAITMRVVVANGRQLWPANNEVG